VGRNSVLKNGKMSSMAISLYLFRDPVHLRGFSRVKPGELSGVSHG
jgi:hypothetical protein